MSGAAFILAINLTVGGLFCASFLLIASYDRQLEAARWFALTYLLGMLNAAVEALIPLVDNAGIVVVCAYMAFAAALLVLNVGITRYYGVATPRRLLAVAFVASFAAVTATLDMPRDMILRLFLYQAPYFLMQAIGVAIVLSLGERRPVDWLLAGLLGLSALHYLAKPVIAMSSGGVGDSPQDYINTTYAMFSQSMGTVLAIATALVLLGMLIARMLKDITARSETDALSGLLNRRGFEDRLAQSTMRGGGLPLSLVICDLDRFKAVNDTWGHAAGDRLIARFAAALREAAGEHHMLGRIGGEEFAVILPGVNLAAGRLFAESVRTVLAGLDIAGLPHATRFTASFGVAELAAGESADSLFKRADAALYEAKGAGRDCVRVGRFRQMAGEDRAVPAR